MKRTIQEWGQVIADAEVMDNRYETIDFAAKIVEQIFNDAREDHVSKTAHDAVERAASALRFALVEARAVIVASNTPYKDTLAQIDYALLSGAGTQFVPRSELDGVRRAGWRSGMTDASDIVGFNNLASNHAIVSEIERVRDGRSVS